MYIKSFSPECGGIKNAGKSEEALPTRLFANTDPDTPGLKNLCEEHA